MRTCLRSLRLFPTIVLQIIILISFATSSTWAVDVSLAWDETTSSSLAGYKIYYRTCPAGEGCTGIGTVNALGAITTSLNDLVDRNAPQYTVKGLPAESDFVFVVTAYTSNGLESGFSNEAYYRAPAPVPDVGSGADDQPPTRPARIQGTPRTGGTSDEVVLTWSASSDDTGVSSYAIYRDGAHIGDATGTRFVDTDVSAGATYVYTILALDAAGNVSLRSAPFSIALPTPAPGGGQTAALRINCGGGRYWDNAGNEWAADTGFNTGRASNRSVSIGGTSDDELYTSRRWDPSRAPEMEYGLPLANGNYLVNLHFAETYSGAFGAGRRVFDVFIENASVESRLDIFSEVSANTALIKSYPVTVNDGQINIRFGHGVENPLVCAIEVVIVAAGSDILPPPAPQSLTGAASPDGNSISLSWSAVSDAGGSGVDGYVIYRDGRQIGYTSETTLTDDGVQPGRTYRYEVSAVDGALNESEYASQVQITTADAATPPAADDRVTLRINAGGKTYTDRQGNRWSADTGYNTGLVAKRAADIGGSVDDELYTSRRWDPNRGAEMEYGLPLANGNYTVNLHFAEIFKGAFNVGRRVFDVFIENASVESRLDIYAEVGARTALVKSYPVTVNDGQINIRFGHRVENPLVCAIEIIPDTH